MFRKCAANESGAVLVVALIFLLLLALVGTTVIQTSELEFRMAGNDQFREEAFQYAQAIATAMSASEDDVIQGSSDGEVGYVWCNAGNTSSDCDETTLTLSSTVILPALPTGVTADYRVTRITDEPPKLSSVVILPENTSEDLEQKVSLYEIRVDYDGSSRRLGKATVIVGVALRSDG